MQYNNWLLYVVPTIVTAFSPFVFPLLCFVSSSPPPSPLHLLSVPGRGFAEVSQEPEDAFVFARVPLAVEGGRRSCVRHVPQQLIPAALYITCRPWSPHQSSQPLQSATCFLLSGAENEQAQNPQTRGEVSVAMLFLSTNNLFYLTNLYVGAYV